MDLVKPRDSKKFSNISGTGYGIFSLLFIGYKAFLSLLIFKPFWDIFKGSTNVKEFLLCFKAATVMIKWFGTSWQLLRQYIID